MQYPQRLDVVVSAMPGVESRARAARLIAQGKVRVNRRVVQKAAFAIQEADEVEILSLPQYVGLGGEKLHKALQHFGIQVQQRVWLDAGASTGGFTDCLLRHGAARVIAVDVGSGQLHASLRKDPRVLNLENTDIRNFSPGAYLQGPLHGICADLSFISLGLVLPFLLAMATKGTVFLFLLKPQFETPPGSKSKKGIVKNPSLREKALQEAILQLQTAGVQVHGTVETDVEDASRKNIEYLIYASIPFDVADTN